MIDGRVIAAAIATVAIGAAPLAAADPTSQPVPNMKDTAELGKFCSSNTGRYIFGTDAGGRILVCGGPGHPGVWAETGTVVGVRQIGSKCVAEIHKLAPDNNGSFVAQSPDGVALTCSYPTDSWEPRPHY
jgi:hypothetical protein